MGRGEARGHLHGDLDRPARRQRAALQRLAQGFALEQLRDDVRRLALDVHVVDRDHVGMAERRSGPRLLLEAAQPIGCGWPPPCGSTLMATSRPSRASRARNTSPMPPAPIGATISYGPSRAPGGNRHGAIIVARSAAVSTRTLIHCPPMQSVEAVLARASDFVWGPPLLILLFGTHLFLTFRLRFIQRYLPQAIRLSFSAREGGRGRRQPVRRAHDGAGRHHRHRQHRRRGHRGGRRRARARCSGCGSPASSASPPSTPRRCSR